MQHSAGASRGELACRADRAGQGRGLGNNHGGRQTVTAGRALAWLRGGVIAAFAAAIMAGIFLPVYTDEVGWRFQERAALDGVDKLYTEACGANTLARPAWFMWPARWYSALFNTAFADPFWIRVSGILYALCFGALLLVLVRRIARSTGDRAMLATVGLALMTLANMPLLLVLSRPEQTLVLTAICALVLAFAPLASVGSAGEAPTETPGRTAWVRSGMVLLLASIAFSYHLKGLMLTPLFLACAFFASRGRAAITPRAAAMATLVVFAALAASYWQARLSCPADAILRAEFARNNTTATLGQVRDIPGLIAQVKLMAGQISVFQYVRLAIPEQYPLSMWLPENQIGRAASFHWFLALVAAWAAVLLAGAVCLAAGAWQAARERRLDPRVVLSLVLLGTVLAWSATQNIRNFYEAGWILPLLMLCALLALSALAPEERRVRKGLAGLAAALGIAALISPVLIARLWGPTLSRSLDEAGYASLQPNSVSPFNYGGVRPDIVRAARLCGLPPPEKARALAMDDVTYFHVIRSYLPQHQQGVFGGWKGEQTDSLAYLRSRRSDGVLVSCKSLGPELRKRARRVGDICCMGADDLRAR